MPKILESEALTIARSIDQAPETDRPWMLDLLDRYQQQQRDEGEPDWPSVERARMERENNLRSMFEAPDKITYDPGPFSQNPQEAKMLHANMALLSARYQKEPAEVASRYDFLLNDYARQKLGASEDVDTAKFYALAQKDMQRIKLREDTQREGMSAALRGEDGVKALAAWQAKNADRAKDDAGLFMRGYQQALEQDGEMLPIADRLLKALESGTDKTGQNVQANMERGQVRQELGQMVEQLAGMKKAQRKSVYRAIAARIEAAGYDQKGFWSQMLGFLDQQLYRAETTLSETSGIASDVASNFPAMLAEGMTGNRDFGITPSETAQTDASVARRKSIGNVQQEIMQIVSGELDPVKPVTGWMNETIETGLIKGPGAVAPFMAASALLGPYGAGVVFTADFAAQNRRELVQSGLDDEQAQKIAVMAAPLQAAVESLSNMVSLGKFPAVQAALSRFTRPVGGASLVGRYVQNSLISGATEFTEEQVQDNVVVPAMQELLGALEKDVPEVDWSFYKTRAANATPELAATLLPMALVFGGVMTAADAKLSRTMTQNVDLMMATGMDQAQAVDVASQPTQEQRIRRGAELWNQRKGTKASMEEAQKKLADQYRTLAADSAAAVKELEARGVLPRLLPMQGGEYRLTFNDGSTADFKTREEALGGIHVYIRDRMQRSTRALRETIDTLTKNLEQGREFALEISPEAMPADEAVKRGIISPQALQERAEQGAILDATTLIENSVLTGKALGDEEAPLMLFGMSKNEWYDKEGRAIGMQRIKDDILRTTMRLWDGASPLTLIEEKTEGDAKVILSTPGKRQWMLDHLRAYEDASGDKLFTSDDNEQINDKQLIEAWSHMAQSYFVAAKDKVKGRTLGRYLRDIEEAELTAAMQGRASWWQAVVNRAQKLGELKAAGKLNEDVVAELEKQLGIDSQVKHEQEAMQEAQNVANEVAQQVDTSGYSEANPGPNGETFSIGRVKNGGRLLTFEKPIETPLGRVVSYEWQSDVIEDVDKDGEAVLKRVSDWDKAVANAETGRAIVHHFTVIQPDGSEKIVSLESALKATKGTETGKALNAAVKAARRLPLREAELAELEKLQADYDAAIQEATSQGWRNAPEPELRTPEFPPLAERGVKAVYVGGQFIKNLEPNELGSFGYKPSETEWKKQWAVGQLQRPPYGTGDRIQTLRRLIKKDKALIDSASLFSSRAIPADASKVVQMPDGARLVGPTTFSIRAFHGTPHKVDRFSLDKIGTGEGAQAYGWGLYFAESREVGEGYRDKLAQWTLLTSDGKIYDDRKELKNLNVRAVLNKNGSIEEAIARAKSVIESIPGTQGAELALADISTLEELKGRGGLTKTKGNLYTVELLPDADEFLDWDKPLAEQSEKVKAALKAVQAKPVTVDGLDMGGGSVIRDNRRGQFDKSKPYPWLLVSGKSVFGLSQADVDRMTKAQTDATGENIYTRLTASEGSQKAASEYLASLGIPGIRYLDGGSRGAGDGTRNYVIFDENLVRILEENGQPVAQDTFSLRVTPAQDAEYMAAVEAGDMEKAQRMVDEVAKAADVTYTAKVPVSRLSYGELPGVGEERKLRDGDAQPLIVERTGAGDTLALADGYHRLEGMILNGETEVTVIILNSKDSDAVSGLSEQREFRRIQEEHKGESADPVTRDDAGNVIPLSQRFNPADDRITYSLRVTPAQDAEYMAAVEAGDMEKAQRMVDEAAKAVGGVSIKSLKKRTDLFWRVHGPEFNRGGSPFAVENASSSTLDGEETLPGYSSFESAGELVDYWNGNNFAGRTLSDDNVQVVAFTGQKESKKGADGEPLATPDMQEVYRMTFGALVRGDGYSVNGKSADPVTRDESGQVIPLSQRFNPADDRITYSLRPGDFASRVEAMFSPFQRSPEARLVMARVAKDRALRVMPQLLELQAQFNDINRQRQDLEAKFAEESAQLRVDLEADEQQVRQERDFELKGVSQDKGSELDRERIRRDADNKFSRLRLEYERSIRELEKRKETETAKLARKDTSAQREKTRQLLRVLDGILAASPPEVRARVGGFVKMAGIATDEAALRYLEDRVAKLDKELEKYLVKQARGQLERIFDKARPKSDAGEKAKGKLTPELHAWFKLAEEAAKLSPAVADERIQGIEQSLVSDMTDAIKQELSAWLGRPVTDDAEAQTWQETRLTLFQTFGAVMYGTDAKSERNAAEITAALDAAREAYQTGRLAHIEQLAKLREKRAEDRGDGIQRVGSPYDPNKANTRKKALNKATGLKGRALDYMDTGLDASGFFLDLLGDDTATDLYETTRRNLLEAAATKADNMEKRKADFAAMLKQVFPGKGLVDRLRGLWELQQIQENAPVGTMSQLQAMQFTLWHLDPDSREWLATNGYGDEWQAKAEQWLTAEAKAVRAWLLKQYDGQYDRLNPVFRRLRGVNLPRVEVYGGKRQIEHSKSDSTASIEADMMRGGMDAGFTKTRVSRPTGRPRMTDALQNYWQNALQVEHYIAFAETVTELKAVFGHRDFLGAVETNRGLAKKQQVLDWISNIETAGTRDAFAHSMQGKLFGRYGKAVSASALLLKLVTLAKQAPAAIQSAFKVGLKEYFTSLSRIMAGKGAISLGDMYRSDTVQRRLSEHDSEMLQASKGWNQRHFDNEILDKAAIAPEVMMNAGWYAMGWTDARFTTISAAVAYDVAFRDGKKLGMTDDEAKAFAANQADLIVMETAQPQDVVTKSLSENMMPQALLRLVFAFQSANRQVFGLTYLAAKQGKVANAYAVAALIAAMTQTIGGIMRMMFSDDDPEELFDPQAYALGMATAPLTGMVGLGPLVEFGLNFFGVESRFSPSSAAAAKSLQDIVNGEADTKDVGRVVSMAGAALGGRGAMLGVGWNVLNQIMGLYENVTANE